MLTSHFSNGILSKVEMHNTLSSAIDILIPYNFLRYMYISGISTKHIKDVIEDFNKTGIVQLNDTTYKIISDGFKSNSASDEETLGIINDIYLSENYLLDPHGAVSLIAADSHKEALEDLKLICLATAHPAKFPEVIMQALNRKDLPFQATHYSIENAKSKCEKVYLCDHSHIEEALINIMENDWNLNH